VLKSVGTHYPCSRAVNTGHGPWTPVVCTGARVHGREHENCYVNIADYELLRVYRYYIAIVSSCVWQLLLNEYDDDDDDFDQYIDQSVILIQATTPIKKMTERLHAEVDK